MPESKLVKTLKVSGVVSVSGFRSFTSQKNGKTYKVIDVYVEGLGPSSIFLRDGHSPDDVIGLKVSIFNKRLTLVPVYKGVVL